MAGVEVGVMTTAWKHDFLALETLRYDCLGFMEQHGRLDVFLERRGFGASLRP